MSSPDESQEEPPRRSMRSNKGVLPVRFRGVSAESDAQSSVSQSVSTVSSSSSKSRRRAELEAAVRLAKLEKQKLEQEKKIVELELASRLAEIDEDDSSSAVQSEDLVSVSASLTNSFHTCAVSAEEEDVELDDSSSKISAQEQQLRKSPDGNRDDGVANSVTDIRMRPALEAQRASSTKVRETSQEELSRDTSRRGAVMSAFALQAEAADFCPEAVAAPSRSVQQPYTPGGQSEAMSKWQSATPAGTASGRRAAEVQTWVNSVPPYPGIQQHHIRPLDLPKFNGEQKSYIRWRQKFLRLVDDDNMTSEDYKLARLREALEGGTAEELITDFLDGPGAYRMALQELDAWYGSDDRELERQQRELTALPRITAERDTEKLQQLAVKLRNVLLNFRTANLVPGRDLYLSITQKMPRGLLTRYIESHDDSKTDINALSKWMIQRVHTYRKVDNRLEDLSPKPVTRPTTNVDRRPPRSGRNFTGTAQVVKCSKCAGSHSLESCPEFKTMSVAGRWEFVKPSDVCIKCLKAGHRSANCSVTPCPRCKKAHHALLHHDRPRGGDTEM